MSGNALLAVRLRHHLSRIDLDVDLRVERETLALVGPSGAGKTSVLRAIAGLMKPDFAHITYAGRALTDTERGVDLPPDGRRCGMMFQDGALFPHLTIERNIDYGLRPRPRGRAERRARVAELLRASASRTWPGRDRARPRAASANGPPWPVPSPPRLTSCCSTSHSRPSTPSPRRKLRRSSPSGWRSSVSRPSSSPTTMATSSDWPTASP